MTLFAGGADLAEMRVLVARRARHGRVLEAGHGFRRGDSSRRGLRRLRHVTAGARDGPVAADEELRRPRVRERAQLERRGSVAGLASLAHLALVHVLVARHAGGLQAAEVDRLACRGGDAALRQVPVASGAGLFRVFAGQREARRCVVELRLLEAGVGMTVDAVLLERPLVRVRVAGGATIELRGDLRRRPRVALGARDRRVRPAQRETRLAVFDLLGLPGFVGVAGEAGRERRPVWALVAVRALRVRYAPVLLVDVALGAVDPGVSPGQRECRLAVVELRFRFFERDRGRMAAPAIDTERAFVHIGMARITRLRICKKGTGLVTLRAVGGDGRVATVEDEARFCRVVERFRIERSQFAVHALVLDVAAGAVVGDVPMNALLRRDPVGHGLVAIQTQRGRDLAAWLVALLAVRRTFEPGVRLGQRSRRYQLPELRGCRARSRQESDGHQDTDGEKPAPLMCRNQPSGCAFHGPSRSAAVPETAYLRAGVPHARRCYWVEPERNTGICRAKGRLAARGGLGVGQGYSASRTSTRDTARRRRGQPRCRT